MSSEKATALPARTGPASAAKRQTESLTLRARRALISSQGFLLGLILIIGIQTSAASQFFLTVENLTNVSRQVAVVGILASGTTILMLTGLLDLTIGAAAALTGLLTTRLILDAGFGSEVAALAAVLAIVALNAAMGVVIALTTVPPFMLTLAVWTMLGGVNLLVQGDFPLSLPENVKFDLMAQREILPHLSFGVLLCLLLWLLVWGAMHWSPLVHQMRAVGSNEEAARLAGIRVERVKVLAHVFNGVVVGLAGLVLLSRLSSASADAGLGLEIETIAAVVIGGASLAGGKASIVGSALGVLLIGLIGNSLNLQQVPGQWQSILYGAVIAVAVVGRELRPSGRLRRRLQPQTNPAEDPIGPQPDSTRSPG